ncbi:MULTISPECIES: ABC-F family ATP-binding cassette domain-containing protein [unclassified Streptomyces]|uniref:ABC-F family ATP-binding cassette domain-containing protein n=1 Tax=unclassified Streptomyces TaxID=2593676 RepID=UPI00136AB398|nr:MULTISPECIES: ABC-F family ATP-binding cassette domain-containing protein [unclassified Streptomyces]NEA03635.1 ABC-F family ATP-binding cassette domain-containing protein [Streptomyces sp. SID10116]MYY84877.1 ATP-binding cassette domain-containing protein [Streptomyces sp. SID335]MYZ14505.1 ATP-binding cassette domain-containing protein [Streptomyces sp. SID337]NDZ92046.1 ABC-F family ATP-binding cassette domain-containing protein [Streptomyces sp. SID10115]NEB50362.1 ABC-F family ATP-bind
MHTPQLNPSPSQLTLSQVTKRYPGRVVLDRVSFSLKPGEKTGLIGDNGAGKSTLLQLVAGQLRPDGGDVTVTAPGGVGHLPQAIPLPATATVQDAVDLALADLRALEAELRRAERTLDDGNGPAALDHYGALLGRFEARGGYDADRRVDVALHHLGLPALRRDRRLDTLSGGERSRLALAGVLAGRPELLLLDEPTNDLDDQALEWLEAQLREHRGTVLAVTHDRVFLERWTTTILEVEEGEVTRYGDGYAGYRTAKAAQRRRRLQEYEEWRAELTRSERLATGHAVRLEAIPRKAPLATFGHGGFRARGRAHGAMARIRNARERVERLTANPVAPPPDPLAFTAQIGTAGTARDGTDDSASAMPGAAVQLSEDAVRLSGVADVPQPDAADVQPSGAADVPQPDVAVQLADVRVGNRLHLDSLSLCRRGRLLVTGPNGAGKTTLLKVLAGELRPDEGSVRVPGRVGHLRQDQTPWPPDLTVTEAFGLGRVGSADEHADALLALGLFRPAQLRLRMGEISYGQRRRVDLARLVSQPTDLLLLDEPTNHLSPALVEELEEALTGFPGAIVLVTHDRALRTRFRGEHLELPKEQGTRHVRRSTR